MRCADFCFRELRLRLSELRQNRPDPRTQHTNPLPNRQRVGRAGAHVGADGRDQQQRGEGEHCGRQMRDRETFAGPIRSSCIRYSGRAKSVFMSNWNHGRSYAGHVVPVAGEREHVRRWMTVEDCSAVGQDRHAGNAGVQLVGAKLVERRVEVLWGV